MASLQLPNFIPSSLKPFFEAHHFTTSPSPEWSIQSDVMEWGGINCMHPDRENMSENGFASNFCVETFVHM